MRKSRPPARRGAVLLLMLARPPGRPARSRTRTPDRRPSSSTGPRPGSRARRRARRSSASAGGVAELVVVGRHDHHIGVLHGLLEGHGRASATWGSCATTSASSRSSSRISLCASESRSSSVSALNARPSTATLRPASAPRLAVSGACEPNPGCTGRGPAVWAQPAFDAFHQEQGHRLVHTRDREQHSGCIGALLGEGEVLAQSRCRP